MSRLAVVVALAACSHRAPPQPPPPSEPLPDSPLHGFMIGTTDLITVVADDWTSTKVTVQRWKHADGGSGLVDENAFDNGVPRPWVVAGESFEAVIGHSGLAWGAGLHGDGAPKGHTGPLKREGDGASPAGVFRIGQQFTFDASKGRRTITSTTECVDDPNSASYNEIVERTGSADWTSSEHMRAVDQYTLGAFIGVNPKRTPGDGSCIFLHIWAGPDSTTVGCTAMPRDRLEELLSGLGSDAVLVQLPKAEYDALRKPWGLPAL